MLNIKDPEAHALAKELAERRNTSMTRAVVDALKRDLERLQGETEARQQEKLHRLLTLAREFRDAVGPDFPNREQIDTEMYDENGLPR